ncbi:MAG: hypothetical protein IGS50_19730 [Synechococcales cyanobacterium C42_A2020_086]|nr:hypothetical protein [Synechococcales cyanobacterium C42_A2020_086]
MSSSGQGGGGRSVRQRSVRKLWVVEEQSGGRRPANTSVQRIDECQKGAKCEAICRRCILPLACYTPIRGDGTPVLSVSIPSLRRSLVWHCGIRLFCVSHGTAKSAG